MSLLRRIFYALVLQSVEAFIAMLTLIVALPVLINPDSLSPSSLNNLLPPWLVTVWAGGMVFGSTVTLLGIARSRYRVERAGVAALVGTSTIYVLGLTTIPSGRAWISMATYLLFILALVARYWVIGRLIRLNDSLNGLRHQAAALQKRVDRLSPDEE